MPPERPGAEGMLAMFNDYPSLLPDAPEDVTREDVEIRAALATQCIHCGAHANTVYLARHRKAGRKWLDLCEPCLEWVKEALARIRERAANGERQTWEERE